MIISMVITLTECLLTIVATLLILSPLMTESRIRNFLRLTCCCFIHDDEVLDTLVYWISSQQSFKGFSLTDIIIGLLMTNMIYHDKRAIVREIDNPDERLEVKKMRVHEYIQYIKDHRFDALHISCR